MNEYPLFEHVVILDSSWIRPSDLDGLFFARRSFVQSLIIFFKALFPHSHIGFNPK